MAKYNLSKIPSRALTIDPSNDASVKYIHDHPIRHNLLSMRRHITGACRVQRYPTMFCIRISG